MTTGGASLVGRSRELAALRSLFDEVRGGTGRTVVIAGESGIGKTRLAAEFLAGVGDAVVLRGHCVDSGSGPVPDAAVADLTRALARRIDQPVDLADRSVPLALADAVADLADESTPVIVVLEDLHWADDATRTLIARLARGVSRVPLLLLLTVRTEDVGRADPLRVLLSELERRHLAVRFELERLAHDDAAQLVQALAGEAPAPAEVDRLIARSEGVPFYLEELVRHGGDALPGSMRAVLRLRYERLSPEAQAFCRAAAVGGTSVEHDTVAEVIAPVATSAIQEAVDAHVLVADTDRYSFRHALVREAIYAAVLPDERRRLHTGYAQFLETLRPPSVGVLTRIAEHWWQAREARSALAAAVVGMRAARDAFAASTAVLLGERALQLWERVEAPQSAAGSTHAALIYQVAELVSEDTRPDRALELGWQAVEEWPPDDVAGRARVLGALGYISERAGRADGAVLNERALRLLPLGQDQAIRAELLLERTRAAILGGRDAEALEFAVAAQGAAEDAGDQRHLSRALSCRAAALGRLGHDDAADVFDSARAHAGHDWQALALYYFTRSTDHMLRGAFEDAARVAGEGVARARDLGAGLSHRAMLENNLTEAMIALGDWDLAAARHEQWEGVVGDDVYGAHLHLNQALLQLWRGDSAGAEVLIRSSRATWERMARTQLPIRSRLSVVLGTQALDHPDSADGGPGAALEHVAWVRTVEPFPSPTYLLGPLALAARAVTVLRRQGEDPDVAPYREVLSRCARWPTYPVWAALFAAELGDGPWSSVAELPGPAHLRPYALYRDGAARLDAGDRTGGREQLTRALTDGKALGAGLVTDRAAALMEQAGLEPRSGRPDAPVAGIDSLTVREAQVLALVAEGLTNKQIAARLFIAQKTASVHVSAILRKLGAATRTEAAHHWYA